MIPIPPKMNDNGIPLVEFVYAKNQPEYIPLPVVKERNGVVTSRWKLTWKEMLSVLFHGSIYLQVMTFNKPLQPMSMSVSPPNIPWTQVSNPLDAQKEIHN